MQRAELQREGEPTSAHRFVAARPGAPVFYHEMRTPIGTLVLTSDGEALTGCHQESIDHEAAPIASSWQRDPGPLRDAVTELEEYFASARRSFALRLAPSGTAFQLEVWAALMDVGYGEVASYGDIAAAVGRPTAYRAVGAANGANPISIIVPCHRIIGSNGTLTGYGYGLERKQVLLDLEQSSSSRGAQPLSSARS